MLICPTCRVRLQRAKTREGTVHACRSCSGRAVTFAQLRSRAAPDFSKRLHQSSAASTGEAVRACPMCSHAMAKVELTGHGAPVVLDVCSPCQLVWFDPGEWEQAAPPAGGSQPPPLPPAAAGAAAVAAPPAAIPRPEVYDEDLPGPGDDGPAVALTGADHLWQYLPALLGMPIELGPNRLRAKPWITWVLGGFLVLLYALYSAGGEGDVARVIRHWGFIPARWSRRGGLTLLTSFLLHAGWLHVLGNTYFLLIFGDNVEDHLGWGKYVLLLLASHLGGMMLHAGVSGDGHIPCVGASAGIAGVIAYYAIVFPRAKIGIFGWLLTLFRILRMPAVVGLVLYVLLQLYGVYQSSHGSESSVAYLAHLGGLAVGGTVGICVRLGRTRPGV